MSSPSTWWAAVTAEQVAGDTTPFTSGSAITNVEALRCAAEEREQELEQRFRRRRDAVDSMIQKC